MTALATLFGVAGCGAIGGGSGGSREVTAYFEDSAGLFVGNDVGILGVTVGKITEIEPDGKQVKVTMRIDGDQKLPADVEALVVARSVATDRYVELSPVYRKGPELAEGDDIPLGRTATPVDFDDVLESLNEFATGIAGNKESVEAIRRFIDAGDLALRGRGPLLNQTIHALADGVGGLHASREDIAATLRSLDVFLATVAQHEGTANTFIRQVADAAELLNSERENFRTALRSLDDAVTLVAQFAVDNREQIIRTMDGSTRLMRTILRKQRQLQEILRTMPFLLENIQMTVTPDGRLPVIMDPDALLPLPGLLKGICDQLGAGLCDLINLIPLGRPAPATMRTTTSGGVR